MAPKRDNGSGDSGLGAAVRDVLSDGLLKLSDVVKTPRGSWCSDRSRKKRSTILNQDALAGVKCM